MKPTPDTADRTEVTSVAAVALAAAPEKPRQLLVAILLMCAAVACFATTDSTAKWLSRTVDPVQIAFGRYFFSVLFVSIVLNPWTKPRILHSNRFGLQIIRTFLLFGCTILNFISLQYLQLTQAVAIQFAMPLIVALLAGPILGEWAGPRRLFAIAIGFCGVLVITRPGAGTMHWAMLLSLVNAVMYAFYAIITRMLAAYDPSSTTIFYSGVGGVIVLAPVVPFFWTTPESIYVWLALVGIGLLGAIGHGLLILAHGRAPAPALSPFVYTQIVWMALLGYFVFGDVPDAYTLAGAAIVIGSGLYLLIWERQRRPRP